MKLQYKLPLFPVLSARLIHIKINKTVEYKKELSSCKLATRRAFDAFDNLFNFGYFKTNRLTKKKNRKKSYHNILFGPDKWQWSSNIINAVKRIPIGGNRA